MTTRLTERWVALRRNQYGVQKLNWKLRSPPTGR